MNWTDESTIDSDRYFLTAGHCVDDIGNLQTSHYLAQTNLNSNVAGTEVVNQPPYSSYDYENCLPGHRCWLMEASAYKWTSSSYAEQAKIAWTEPNSSVITGRMTVTDMDDPVQDETVHMIGYHGRQSGEVAYPCGTLTKENGDMFFCQGVGKFDPGEGDSGGPVVRLTSSNTVTALGVVYYHYSYWCNWPTLCRRGVFSITSGIIQEMYFASSGAYYFDPTNASSRPTAPSPPEPPSWYAVVSGVDHAPSGITCHWFSGSNVENATIDWYVDGNIVGHGTDLYRSSTSDFEIQVHYYNQDSGASAWDAISVTVTQGGSCDDM